MLHYTTHNIGGKKNCIYILEIYVASNTV